LTIKQTEPKGTCFWCIERKSTLLRLCSACVEGTKKMKNEKAQLHPSPQPTHPRYGVFCMRNRTVDIIKHTKFQLYRFSSFGAPGSRK